MRTKYVQNLWVQINDLKTKLDSRDEYIKHLQKNIEELKLNQIHK